MERIARIVNFRVFLITAITAIFSILAVILLPFVASIIAITLFGIALAIFLAFAIKSKNAVRIITTILCFLTATICIVSTSISINAWKSEIELDKEYEITARIQSINKTDFGAGYILTEFSADNASKNGNIYLTVYNSDGVNINFLKVGDTIKFKSSLNFYQLVDKTPDGYRYRNDIRYGAQVDENAIEFINANPNFLDTIKNSVYTALIGALGENGAIAYGMITGEKGFMSDSATDSYSASGLGHILAVSGLHIGFIVLIISFLLDKLKANRVVKLAVISPLLLAYCFLASFSPSVIRATIMCIVGLIADMFAQRRDTLNSLSLAVTVMLIVKPLYLFDIGFIMSVTAVFGIILFARTLGIAFGKFLPKFIAKPLAVSLSAQIGITPVSIVTFNTFSLYSVLTNLLMIPLVTVAFIAISLALVLVLIFPSCSVVLTIAGLPLALVDTVANLIDYLPCAQIKIFASSFFVISY
ncbi:MAG: ComEC/Rec2 family competence protein, partial [Clostridia bacterium]|nr:ComEC/Rec2 family competence protein [Clostridia bacterium]